MTEKSLGMKSPTGGDNWVAVQKKTFTRWVNNHLRKHGFTEMKDVQEEFETGIKLMEIINSLYKVPMPAKYNKAPKLRPHKLDNITLAMKMMEDDAKIKTNFLKTNHLADKDLKMILGMLWSIILDYAIKGISVDDLNAKEGLLLWCRKKTAGYKHIDPPGINNFSANWRNGLAFCALIHRHQPQALDYSSLDPANAKHNLSLAFAAAEKLGIPRLLEEEDCMAERPDDKAIMTQVAEYFRRFASQDLKEVHARRAQKCCAFARRLQQLKTDYETRAKALADWIQEKQSGFTASHAFDTLDDVMKEFDALKGFLVEQKPAKSAEKLDLEAKFAEIQTELKVNGRLPYAPPAELTPEALESAWSGLQEAEKTHAAAVRESRFKFVQKEEMHISEEQLKECKDSFDHFDVDHDNTLNKSEFKSAAAALSVPFKDDAHFDKVFNQVSEGKPSISVEQFTKFMRTLQEDKGSPDELKAAFNFLADEGKFITPQQLQVPPLTEEDVSFLLAEMPKTGDNQYDYAAYVEKNFLPSK